MRRSGLLLSTGIRLGKLSNWWFKVTIESIVPHSDPKAGRTAVLGQERGLIRNLRSTEY
jgi:hypothetical protein